MAFGIGKKIKKAAKRLEDNVKSGWKNVMGWADDAWMKDYVAPIVGGTVLGALTGGLGAVAVGASTAGGATAGGIAGGLAGTQYATSSVAAKKQAEVQIKAAEEMALAQQQASYITQGTAAVESVQQASALDYNSSRRKRFGISRTYLSKGNTLGGSGTMGRKIVLG